MPFRRGRRLANILPCSGFPLRNVRGRRCGRRSAATPGCRRAELAIPFQPGARPAGGLPGLRRMPGLEYRPAAQAQALATYRSRPERPPGIEAGAGRRDSLPGEHPHARRSPAGLQPQLPGKPADDPRAGPRHPVDRFRLGRGQQGTAHAPAVPGGGSGRNGELHRHGGAHRRAIAGDPPLGHALQGSPGPDARPDERLDRHHRTGAPGPPVARGDAPGGRGESGEERLPGDHEPRDPYADECGHRHPRTGPAAPGAGAARTRLAGGRLRGSGVAATAHRRHPSTSPRSSPVT